MAIAKLLQVSAVVSLLSLTMGIDASSCKPGTFFNGTSCERCPRGTFQYRKGKTNCNPCPKGTYGPFEGAAGRDLCQPCPAGTFSKAKGAISAATCKQCPKGKSSVPYSSSCISCPKGKMMNVCNSIFQLVTNGVCQDCFKFFCSTYAPRLQCVDCPPLYFGPKRNSRQCGLCPLNSVSSSLSSKCSKCPRRGCKGCRSFQVFDPNFVVDDTFEGGDIERSDGCRPCPAGFVGNKEFNATRCVRCPSGTFKGEDQSGPCQTCESDKPSISSGSSCARCNKQQRLDVKKKICVQCPPSHESAGGLAKKCKPCPRGAVSTREGCQCAPGWGPAGKGCKLCPPGTMAPDYFFYHRCTACRDGFFAPKAGTVFDACRPCPEGKVSSSDKSKCRRCPKGLIVRDAKCVSPLTNCPPDKVRLNSFAKEGKREEFLCVRKK